MTEKKLTSKELSKLSKERLADAKALKDAGRLEGAFYICGYAVEMGLKNKICTTLEWDEYPSFGKESSKYSSFKTHDLEVLLHLSGAEKRQKTFDEWSIVMKWNPEIRYSSDEKKLEEVELMIEATESLLKKL